MPLTEPESPACQDPQDVQDARKGEDRQGRAQGRDQDRRTQGQARRQGRPARSRRARAEKGRAEKGRQDREAFEPLLKSVLAQLEDDKAENVVTIDLEGRASFADVMVIASGRSARHVASSADHLAERVKADGFGRAVVEGEKTGDWAIVDCGDVVVHLFRPEVREFYDLESMWSAAEGVRAANS